MYLQGRKTERERERERDGNRISRDTVNFFKLVIRLFIYLFIYLYKMYNYVSIIKVNTIAPTNLFQ